MEDFIKSIKVINELSNKTLPSKIIEHKVIEKQYIAYYLYRILCKYERLMSSVAPYKKVQEIFFLLKIPLERKTNYCYPMAHKMTRKINKLNDIISKILEIFTIVENTLKISISNYEYKKLEAFLKTKDLETILVDINTLQHLFPNLGVTGVKPYFKNQLNNKNKMDELSGLSLPNKINVVPPPMSDPLDVPPPLSDPLAVPPPLSDPLAVPPPLSDPLAVPPPLSDPLAVPPPLSDPLAVPPPLSDPSAVPPPLSDPLGNIDSLSNEKNSGINLNSQLLTPLNVKK